MSLSRSEMSGYGEGEVALSPINLLWYMFWMELTIISFILNNSLL